MIEVSISFLIFIIVIALFIIYCLIEVGVRRGIDSSKTNELLKQLIEEQTKK